MYITKAPAGWWPLGLNALDYLNPTFYLPYGRMWGLEILAFAFYSSGIGELAQGEICIFMSKSQINSLGLVLVRLSPPGFNLNPDVTEYLILCFLVIFSFASVSRIIIWVLRAFLWGKLTSLLFCVEQLGMTAKGERSCSYYLPLWKHLMLDSRVLFNEARLTRC